MKQRTPLIDKLRALARGTLRTAAGTVAVVTAALLWSLAASGPERADGAGEPRAEGLMQCGVAAGSRQVPVFQRPGRWHASCCSRAIACAMRGSP